MAQDYYKAFIDKLKEIFMMDHAELDFGIYRIMNQKRKDIEHFLEHDLLPQVKDALVDTGVETTAIKQRMAEMEAQAASFGASADNSPEYQMLKSLLLTGVDTAAMENEVFSHLTTFFSRYYDDGDFISKRRYKDNTYAIPYNGEEVKLHWANADQYYIKSSEYFRDYTFMLSDKKKVHFELKDASTEQNNNKAASGMERRFALWADEDGAPFMEEMDGELHIYFTYELMPKGTKQNELMADAFAQIKEVGVSEAFSLLLKEGTAPTEKNKNRTLLEKHLTDYTAKNQFDYFIHKDLGGFLSRELDFYIKNEVMHLDDLDEQHIQRQISQVKAIKKVGNKIVQMLAQLENFQKRLWLKKKFVVQADYCITLDRVPKKLYTDICANDRQREEWVRLFAIDLIEGDLQHEAYSEPLTETFLEQNLFLVLDTAFFSLDFKRKLLASMDNIDEECNGLLINSENFQALELLQEKYRERVDGIHIDPPYNTDTSGFLYKNNYRHSSWLSMMNERINSSLHLLTDKSTYMCHIDENEYEHLKLLYENSFLNDAGTIIWDKRNPMTGGGGVAKQHEYIICYNTYMDAVCVKNENVKIILDYANSLVRKCNGIITTEIKVLFSKWVKENENLTGGEKAYSLLDNQGQVYRGVSLRAPEPRDDPKFHIPLIHPITGKPCPVPPNGFSRTPETLKRMMDNGEILFGADESVQPQQKRVLTFSDKKPISSVIIEAKKGKADLDDMHLNFPYCHSVRFYEKLVSSMDNYILDFFAGSGTTAHAVINLNRQDKGSRKFILCEVNEYCNTVTRPRIQKVIYSSDWKDGKPVSRDGISQCIKYIRLEQYEDTLNNLVLGDAPVGLFDQSADFRESYMLSYMLDTETRGSLFDLKKFENPFGVSIKTTRDNEQVETPVDMVETFNYLIGLDVTTMSWHGDGNICVVEGRTHRRGDKTLVIWRNRKEIDNKQLNDFFEKMNIRTRDSEFDLIYVNGDNTLPNLRRDEDHWKVMLIEEEFEKRMFDIN